MKSINRKLYIEKFIKIVNKDGELVSLRFNYAQNKLYDVIKKQTKENKPVRIIILKARQM